MPRPRTKSLPIQFRVSVHLEPELLRRAALEDKAPSVWVQALLEDSLTRSLAKHEASQKEAGR